MKYLTLLALILAASATQAGAQWTRTSGPGGGNIKSLVVLQNDPVILLQSGEIYRYSIGDWNPIGHLQAYEMQSADSALLANTESGLMRSTDGGLSWQNALPSRYTYMIDVQGSTVFAQNETAMILRSSDAGATWQPFANHGPMVQAIASDGPVTFVGLHDQPGVLRTVDDGATWDTASEGFPKSASPLHLYFDNGSLYASLATTSSFRSQGVYRSDDLGETWYEFNEGLAGSSGELPQVKEFFEHDGAIAISTATGVYRYEENRWAQIQSVYVTDAAVAQSGRVYLGTLGGVIESDGQGWSEIGTGLNAADINALSSVEDVLVAAANDGVHRTTDQGATWTRSLIGRTVEIAQSEGVLYARQNLSGNDGLYRSMDAGTTWRRADDGIDQPAAISTIAATPNALFAGLYVYRRIDGSSRPEWVAGGVYRSTDQGTSWVPVNEGLPHHDTIAVPVLEIAAIDRTVIARTIAGLFRSTDNGAHWEPLSPPDSMTTVSTVAAHDGDFFVAAFGRLSRSSDNGESWRDVEEADEIVGTIEKIYSVGSTLLGRTSYPSPNARIYSLQGNRLQAFNDSLPSGTSAYTFTLSGDHMMMGTLGSGVWSREIAVSGVEDVPRPAAMLYARAFPSPTTSTSTILFELVQAGDVSIEVVTVQGEQVYEKDLGRYLAGTNTTSIDLSDLAPGVYFYRLSTSGSQTVGRLVKQ